MPELHTHIQSSLTRTGKEYREVHEWIDNMDTKYERHDFSQVLKNAKMFTEHQLQAIGAAVWAALEEDTATLHERFYPNGDAPITKAQLCDELWEVQDKLRSLGVDMG